jgi:transcriptional regulator with XRE-family HTH domain
VKIDLKQAFGKVIRELREENELSQQELADFSEVDRTYISDLERGLNYPSLNTIYKLAEVLKIKPSKLIEKVDAVVSGFKSR